MILVKRALLLLLLVEIAVIGWRFADRLARPEPPAVNLSRLATSTATDFQSLHRRAVEEATADAWQELAEAYMAYGYFPEAEVCFQYRETLEPELVYVTYGRAYCLERLGRMQDAIIQFRRAAELADEQLFQACWYHIGRNALCLEDATQAEEAFRTVQEFPAAKYQLAKLLVRSDRCEEAVPLLDELLQQSPHELVVLQLRAQAAEQLGEFELAARFRDEAERADHSLVLNEGPELLNPILVRYGLGRDLFRCGSFRTSGFVAAESECIYEVFRANPDQWWYLRRAVMQSAQTEVELGNPDQALNLLEGILEHTNVTPECLELVGDAWSLKGSTDRAVEAWERSARMRPSETVHRKLAGYYRENGAAEVAARHEALADHESGRLAFHFDQLDEARTAFARAVEQDPKLPHSWFYLGEVQRLLGHLPEAREAFGRCLGQAPYHGRARDRLARITEPESISENSPVDAPSEEPFSRKRETSAITYGK